MRAPLYDVAIAGAGPAGSTLALRLARAGFSVVIVEARSFPRPKPCGEFLSPECLPLLDELGVLGRVRALGAREVRGMLLCRQDRRARGDFTPVGRARATFDHGLAVRRERFDAVLLDAALATGVELVSGGRVTGVVRAEDGAARGLVVRDAKGRGRAIAARWTIGADGLRSRVADAFGVRTAIPWLDKIALATRYAGIPWGDRAEVHFQDRGYFACAPVDGGLVSLNLVVDRAAYLRAGLGREAALARALEENPAIGARIVAGTRADPVRGLGPLAFRTSAQTFDGAALVGDACGYVDPVTGEGIWFALVGARMLAEPLVAALHARRVDRAALAPYLAGRAREIAPRAALATMLQRGLRHPTVVRNVLRLLEARPSLADLLVSVAGDYVPLAELGRPSVWLAALRSPRVPRGSRASTGRTREEIVPASPSSGSPGRDPGR